MKQDIRKGIKSSFLYKRFAYNSEGFIELMKFLKNENIIEDFFEECDFTSPRLANDLESNKKEISLKKFFLAGFDYSFPFAYSRKGTDFWFSKIFYNKNFIKIENKLL